MILRMEKFNFPWVYLHDETQKTAQAYGALKTPHFFVFDDSWKLIYTGRNTDNPKDTDLRTTEDLHNVLKEATAGKGISIPITNPIGCNIKWDGKPAHWMPSTTTCIHFSPAAVFHSICLITNDYIVERIQ